MDGERFSGFRQAVDRVVVVAFLAALLIPFLGTALSPGSFDERAENRRPAEIPAFSWRTVETYPRKLEEAFADRFAFRATLVRLASLVRVRLGISPSPKVLIGRDGFLFYAGENAVPQFRRAMPFPEQELAAWGSVLGARREFLAARGIGYLVLFPPNKETIYPESMPKEIRRLAVPSRLDQLFAFLRQKSSVEALDLRPTLAAARRFGRVYHLTDTHWNDSGAVSAYRRIVRVLGRWLPGLEPLPQSATVETRSPGPGGDLAGMLALRDVLTEPQIVSLRVARPRAHDADPHVPTPPKTAPHAVPRAREVTEPELPRAIVFHDSFFDALLPFLGEHFRRTLSLSVHDFPTATIDRERPDVVIEELLERYLMMGPLGNPEGLYQAARTLPLDFTPPGMDAPHVPGEPLVAIPSWHRNDLTLASDGSLVALGDDPYLTTHLTSLEAAADQTIWVTMTARAPREAVGGPSFAQIFWAPPRKGFTENASLHFPILVDGREHAFRVRLGLSREWRGQIEKLRLDLPDVAPGARYEIRGVELCTAR